MFPSFLNPMTAAIAAAIAIPALLLLYFLKLRRRDVDVASTLLWRKSIQDLQVNAPFQKLRRNLLLLIQLLVLALLLLALARPVTRYTPGAGRTSVILIDRSASMSATDGEGGVTRLAEAKRRARELVDTLDGNATAMLIAFDEEARTIQTFTSDRNALRQAIDSIEPGHRRTRLKLAYQLAAAQIAFIPEQNRTNVEPPDVWVYSDGRVADADELKIDAPVKLVTIGNENSGNIAVVALSARRNYERPTEVQLFARFANFGPKPVTAQVQLSIAPLPDAAAAAAPDAFRVARAADVTLAPERWTDEERANAERVENLVIRDSVEFTVELTTAAVVRVEQLTRDGDVLSIDDTAAVVVPPPKALSVLLVSDGNYYLERAIDSLRLQSPRQMTLAEYEAEVPGDFDVIIFDRYSPQKLPAGGNFVYFGGVPTGLRVEPETTDTGVPLLIEEMTVLDWRRDHPILKNLNLGKVFAAAAIRLKVPPESQTLVDGVKGPMVVLHREGRGTHLFVTFDVMQSNWPLRVSFPVFLHQALQFMAVGADLSVRESVPTGTSPVLPRANLTRVAGGEPKSIKLFGPAGERTVEIPPTGDFAFPSLDRVGVYRTDPVVPQYERIAVNLLDAAESNVQPQAKVPGGVGTAVKSSDQKARLELWWWIVACVALPLLMLEWWVYTRRMHL